MSKKLVWVVVTVIVLLSGAVGYLLLNKIPMLPVTNQQAAPNETGDKLPAAPILTAGVPGAYKKYDEASLAGTTGTKILFFHAPWCPQCRQLDSEITAGSVPNNVTIFKVDYDSNQSLRQKYGVTIQTTFVRVDDQCNLLKKYVAYDEPTFAALTKSGLW